MCKVCSIRLQVIVNVSELNFNTLKQMHCRCKLINIKKYTLYVLLRFSFHVF